MVFWILLEYVVAALVVYMLTTQVFVPILQERPLFPWLASRREARLMKQFRETHQTIHEVDVAAQVQELREQLRQREEALNKKDVSGLPVDNTVKGEK